MSINTNELFPWIGQTIFGDEQSDFKIQDFN